MSITFQRLGVRSATPVSIPEIKAHFRLSTQETELLADANDKVLGAAMELEDAGELAFTTQTIRALAPCPIAAGDVLTLPVGPVLDEATATVTAIDHDGMTAALDAGAFLLVAGMRPELRIRDVALPSSMTQPSTRLRIDYPAGFGPSARAVPHDLRLAILDQGLRDFDRRADDFTRGTTSISAHAARIIARYRKVRL